MVAVCQQGAKPFYTVHLSGTWFLPHDWKAMGKDVSVWGENNYAQVRVEKDAETKAPYCPIIWGRYY